MAIVICNAGEAVLLEAMVGKTAAANMTLKLFVSNTTPAHTDTAGTYTEMSTQGYSAQTLTMATWNAASAGTGTGTSLSNKASISYPQVTFTFDGTGGSTVVYGYYIVAGSTLVGAERFASSKTVANNGDAIKITPNLTLSTE